MPKGIIRVRRSGIRPTSNERVVYMVLFEAAFPLLDLESPECRDTDSEVFLRLGGMSAMSSVKILGQSVRVRGGLR